MSNRKTYRNLFRRVLTGGGLRLPSGGLVFKDMIPDLTGTIGELTVLRSSIPANAHATMQQVKGSGFVGAGSATVTGLLTTDTITSTGDVPTCAVDGTLTFGADFDGWDIYVHRAGVLWAYWPGINVGKTIEYDASGNEHHLTALTTTTITERLDGTGTDYINDTGYSMRENLCDAGPVATDEVGVAETVDGFWTLTHLVSAHWAIGISSLVLIPDDLATRTDYTVRATLRALPGQENPVNIGWTESYENQDITIVSGPGTAEKHNGTGAPEITGLSETVDTVVEITRTDFIIGTSTVRFFIWPGSAYLSGIGSGCLIKNIHLCSGTSSGHGYAPPKTPAARVPARTSNINAQGGVICGIGHSLTNAQIPYLRQYFPDTYCIGAGINGNTTAQVLARFNADVVAIDPDVCFMPIGINDILTGVPVSTMAENIEAIVALATAANIDMVLVTISPFGSSEWWSEAGQSATESYNSWLLSYGSENGITVLDVYPEMVATGTDNLATAYASVDGLHYSDAGYAFAARLVADAIATIWSDMVGDVFWQPLMYPGPLRRDLIVTAGTEYPALTVTAPLGPSFQGITEWTNNAAVDLSTLTATANTRLGDRGIAIWNPGLDATGIIRADRVLKP